MMNRLQGLIRNVLTFLLASTFLMFAYVEFAWAQGPAVPVVVRNTVAQPVPTVAQGTTSVTGSVNVANTPAVNVVNNASNPVPVTVAGQTKTTHWQKYLACPMAYPLPISYRVPDGYRVVLEYANVHSILSVPNTDEIPDVVLTVSTPDPNNDLLIELGPVGHVVSASNRYFAASLPIKVVLEPGWVISACNNNQDPGQANVFLSGYLEPVTTP